MSIKVVSVGTKPQDRPVAGTCHTCGTRCEWLASDGKHNSCQREGDWNTITCPTCGYAIHGNYTGTWVRE